jgi:MFS family permease
MVPWPRAPDWAVLMFLCTINLVNFMDRGIVPGATVQFGDFVQSAGVASKPAQQDVWLGVVASSFILCYSIASVLFGHLVHRVAPFRLLFVGLTIWVAAIFISGVAYFLERSPPTFWLFLTSRAVSGVGEAAFQCIIPPYIEDFAPKGSKTLWMGFFFMGIPVGTAFGYVLGANAATTVGWGWAYLLEAFLMVPFIATTPYLPPAHVLIARRAEGSGGPCPGAARMELKATQPTDATAPPANSGAMAVAGADASSEAVPSRPPPTLLQQVCWLAGAPPYVCLVLGFAAYEFTVLGISTFGSLFFLALQMFKGEREASTTLGAVVALGGLLGTPTGGWLTDVLVRRFPDSSPLQEAARIVILITSQMAFALACLISSTFAVYVTDIATRRALFLIFLASGTFVGFGAAAGVTRVTMLIVPVEMRSFAIATLTLVIHALGDVPSPIVIGALLADLAPNCTIIRMPNTSSECEGEPLTRGPNGTSECAALNPNCLTSATDQEGVHTTLLAAALWMIWSVVLWTACYMILRCSRRWKNAREVLLAHQDAAAIMPSLAESFAPDAAPGATANGHSCAGRL